jgi:hypothetical protein
MSPNWGHTKVKNIIQIYSDEDFYNYEFPGAGSSEDPYLIEKLVLGVNESFIRNFYYGLDVSNTTKHFIVQDCIFFGGKNAIRIMNAKEGTVTIKNNKFYHITQYEYDLGIGNSGIEIINTNQVSIENNIFKSATIYKEYFHCLTLDNVNHLTFRNNTNNAGHLDIQDSSEILLIDNIFKNVESIRGMSNLNFTNNVFEGYVDFIQIESCSHTILKNNTFRVSVILWSSSYSKVCYNEIYFQTGIYLYLSDHVDIYNNTVVFSGNEVTAYDRGIVLQRSKHCFIYFNNIYNFSCYGVYLNADSSSNVVFRNSFFHNYLHNTTSQGYDEGYGNVWYEPVVFKGNFWSNLGSNITYEIDGTAESVDLFPLSDPP